MGLPCIHTAGPSHSRYILQSGAPAAALHHVDGGPIAFGIRLRWGNRPGAPLMDIEICDCIGAWRPGTDRTGGVTLQAMGAPPNEIRGVRVQSTGRTGPNDPDAKITRLQLLLAHGVLLPEAGSLDLLKATGVDDAPPEAWTQDYWLPADTRFAGLLLATGWPQKSDSDDTSCAGPKEDPCITDMQVLVTGWLTGNTNYNFDSNL